MKISEFAKRVGVSTVTLRQWESWGWFKPAIRSETKYRYYTEAQVEEFFKVQKERKDIRYKRGGNK